MTMAGPIKIQPHPEWRTLIDAYATADYGTIIPHDTIAQTMGLTYGTRRYYQQVRQWCRVMLREHNKAVRAVPKTGYELVKPEHYTEHSRRRFLQGRRRVKDSVRIAVAAPVRLLTAVQATKHADHLAWLAPVLKVLNKIERNTRPALLGSKRPDLPRLKS